jgi:hypothetical protein
VAIVHRRSEESDMSTQVPPGPLAEPAPHSTRRASSGVGGLTTFAGAMLLVVGAYQVLNGIAALLNDTIYITTPEYVYSFDLTGWGWVHLLLGTAVGLIGAAILNGRAWARWLGIGLVSLSLIANFMFLPHYPLWSSVIIALDITIIVALATPSSRR